MIYHAPNTVISPQDGVRNIRVIFDGGEESFSLARIEWYGDECLAMRWNVSHREWEVPEKVNEMRRCVGMPVSHGLPVWFILPHSEDAGELIKALKGDNK